MKYPLKPLSYLFILSLALFIILQSLDNVSADSLYGTLNIRQDPLSVRLSLNSDYPVTNLNLDSLSLTDLTSMSSATNTADNIQTVGYDMQDLSLNPKPDLNNNIHVIDPTHNAVFEMAKNKLQNDKPGADSVPNQYVNVTNLIKLETNKTFPN